MTQPQMTDEDMFEHLDEMFKATKSWEANELKTSNAKLYAILKDCYDLEAKLSGKQDLINSLNKKLEKSNYVYKKGTKLSTKIVRYVFDKDANRVQAYSRVIEWAKERGIKSSEFVQAIEDAGGIEEIRRSGSDPNQSKLQRQENINNAEKYLTSDAAPYFLEATPSKPISINGDTGVKFVVGLIHVRDGGMVRVVSVDNSEKVVESALEKFGKQKASDIAQEMTRSKQVNKLDLLSIGDQIAAFKE
jgi:hypothetical protein